MSQNSLNVFKLLVYSKQQSKPQRYFNYDLCYDFIETQSKQ